MDLDGAVQPLRLVLQRQQSKTVSSKIGFRHCRAAAVDRATFFFRSVGIMLPALPRRYDVAMRVECDHGALPGAELLANDQVGHRFHTVLIDVGFRHLVALDLETQPFVKLRRLLAMARAIAGRIVRRHFH